MVVAHLSQSFLHTMGTVYDLTIRAMALASNFGQIWSSCSVPWSRVLDIPTGIPVVHDFDLIRKFPASLL